MEKYFLNCQGMSVFITPWSVIFCYAIGKYNLEIEYHTSAEIRWNKRVNTVSFG